MDKTLVCKALKFKLRENQLILFKTKFRIVKAARVVLKA